MGFFTKMFSQLDHEILRTTKSMLAGGIIPTGYAIVSNAPESSTLLFLR